ncbi:hypothetical protein ACFWN2_37030 [Lentzea sp. NPDC058436]|uniref:hypothetical protein n=1 Tax=Lentzea sp. NPDC058436 TaxID=3346499 RepID=UPI0036690EA8
MRIPSWVVLGVGTIAALMACVYAPVRELKGLENVCSQPGARCGSQPDWYTGQESYETLSAVEMSARLPGVEVVYDYRPFWLVTAVVLVLAAVAALLEHRHRVRRRDQANG